MLQVRAKTRDAAALALLLPRGAEAAPGVIPEFRESFGSCQPEGGRAGFQGFQDLLLAVHGGMRPPPHAWDPLNPPPCPAQGKGEKRQNNPQNNPQPPKQSPNPKTIPKPLIPRLIPLTPSLFPFELLPAPPGRSPTSTPRFLFFPGFIFIFFPPFPPPSSLFNKLEGARIFGLKG